MSAPITIVGRLGKDPELRFSASGVAITRLSVVSSGRRKDDSGAWVDSDVTWWNVTAFRRLAENVAESLTKGARVVVVGKIKQRTWETPEGEKRSSMDVTADVIAADLTWDTAKIQRADRASNTWAAGQPAEPDPWAEPAPAEPPF